MDAVELASTDELVPVLEQFKAAAERGEMDDMIAAQITKRKNKKAVKLLNKCMLCARSFFCCTQHDLQILAVRKSVT